MCSQAQLESPAPLHTLACLGERLATYMAMAFDVRVQTGSQVQTGKPLQQGQKIRLSGEL